MPPKGSLTATVYATNAFANATASQVPTLYIYSTAGDSGDGADAFEALPATIDASGNTITVSLPGDSFQPTGAGTYIANLKIGVATATTSPGPAPAQTSVAIVRSAGSRVEAANTRASGGAGLSIPCPFAPPPPSTITAANFCVETSRWNPERWLYSKTWKSEEPYPHYGVDFQATTGTDVYLPAGGTPEAAFTIGDYPTDTRCPGLHCNGGAGIDFLIDYGTAYKLRLLHLSSIYPCILNPAMTDVNLAATTTSCNPVAQTGDTGAAIGSPHLHFEIISPSSAVCPPNFLNCKYAWSSISGNNTDPFPFIASNPKFQETAGNTVLTYNGTYNFQLSAFDSNDVLVSSAVGDPQENSGMPPSLLFPFSGYDPTRKICLSPSSASVLGFGPQDQITTFVGPVLAGSPSYCAKWGTVTATALASSPPTTVSAGYSSDPTVSVAQDTLIPMVPLTWTLASTTYTVGG